MRIKERRREEVCAGEEWRKKEGNRGNNLAEEKCGGKGRERGRVRRHIGRRREEKRYCFLSLLSFLLPSFLLFSFFFFSFYLSWYINPCLVFFHSCSFSLISFFLLTSHIFAFYLFFFSPFFFLT